MSDESSIAILHVDDDQGFADLTADLLATEDGRFTVDTAANPSDALDSLAETEYDCIVSDYEMPGMDGISFLETIREEYPHLPFMITDLCDTLNYSACVWIGGSSLDN